MAHGRPFGVMSGPRLSEGLKGWTRFAQLTEGAMRRNADFIFVIGRNGPSWFRAVGYRSDRIFPFAYFLPDRAIMFGPF
jgi:hypothetical protein